MNKYDEAARILSRYYRKMVSELADEALESRDRFEEPSLGFGMEIVDRYSAQLNSLRAAIGHLRLAGTRPKPPPLRLLELRCAKEAVGKRIEEWLTSNQEFQLVSTMTIPDGEECICLLLYCEKGGEAQPSTRSG